VATVCKSFFSFLAKCSNNVDLHLSTRFCISFVALAVSLSSACLSCAVSGSVWATVMSVTSPVWTAFFNLFSASVSRESANFSFVRCSVFAFFRLYSKDSSFFLLLQALSLLVFWLKQLLLPLLSFVWLLLLPIFSFLDRLYSLHVPGVHC